MYQGGTSTRDEMCQGYITYYPKIPFALCKTQPEFHNFFDALGIRRIDGDRVLKMLHLPYVPKLVNYEIAHSNLQIFRYYNMQF